MNLDDVTRKTVPKMCLISPPRAGGAICTRNFIPHTVHKAIGVFGAVSVATACVVPGSVTSGIARLTNAGKSCRLDVEHPTGFFTVEMDVETKGSEVRVERAALLRTARKLMSGEAFVSSSLWPRD
jgi:4-oxalomesaconate tautomerase